MTSDEKLEQLLLQLGDAVTPGHSVVPAVMARTAGRNARRATLPMSSRLSTLLGFPKVAAGVVVLIVVSLAAAMFLFDEHSSHAFASEALAALDRSNADGLTVQERTIVVMPDESRHISSTWNVLYVGRDGYRRDIYENDQPRGRGHERSRQRGRLRPDTGENNHPREMQWYTRKDNGMLQTSVRFDARSYTLQTHPGGFGDQHPVARMRFLVQFIDEADRPLTPMVIRGRQCPGFEIRASKYGNNPPEWVDRIWFDPETKLPVRIEHQRPSAGTDVKALITVQEQFNWHPELPADTFTPKLPDGFTLQ